MREQGQSQAEQVLLSERRQAQELQKQHQQQMMMSQEYEHCWHSLNTAQAETSVAVATLEDNMKSGRIGEAEVRTAAVMAEAGWQTGRAPYKCTG